MKKYKKISILQKNVHFEFPKPIRLDKTMENYLEEKVDKKYYIENEKSKELIDKLILNDNILNEQTNNKFMPFEGAIGYPLYSREFEQQGFLSSAPTLCARDYKDPKIVVEVENDQ